MSSRPGKRQKKASHKKNNLKRKNLSFKDPDTPTYIFGTVININSGASPAIPPPSSERKGDSDSQEDAKKKDKWVIVALLFLFFSLNFICSFSNSAIQSSLALLIIGNLAFLCWRISEISKKNHGLYITAISGLIIMALAFKRAKIQELLDFGVDKGKQYIEDKVANKKDTSTTSHTDSTKFKSHG